MAGKTMIPLLAFAAWSGTGKTTLLKKLIPALCARGIRPGLIKHTHHDMDVDKPGKDSYELRKAGAAQTIVASQQRWALMTETPDEEELDLHFLASRMDTSKLDLILVEGFKHEEIAKIVLFRDGAGHRPEELVIDRHVIAVASDVPLNLDVARGGTAASPGHSPVERNAPTAEQLLRWSPVPGSVRGEPGTNYRAQKNTLTMIGKGKSISHGVAALEYDLAKEINGQAVATEIARHELYGCTGAEMVQEMKPYHIDFPNVKNNCLRFEVSPSIEESATFTDADWAELGNDFMQRMGLANHQYIIIRHSGTESKKEQAHLHILANRVSLSGELYRDNWIGKKATEAANAIAKERNFVQSQDIGKVNKAEIKEAMDGVLKKMQGFDFTKFKEELGKRGFKVREARASTGKLNGYYVTARSGTEYKASEIGKGYTLAHIERTQSKLKCNSMNISHGNKLTPGSGSFQR